MASDIRHKIEKFIQFGLVYEASPAVIARSITEHFDVRENPESEKPTCGFSWVNSDGVRVRCKQDGFVHGDRHTNGQSWVTTGFENTARQPLWTY